MRRTCPNTLNKSKIIDALAETFKQRRNSITKDKLSVTSILDQYPRLVDYDGDMVRK